MIIIFGLLIFIVFYALIKSSDNGDKYNKLIYRKDVSKMLLSERLNQIITNLGGDPATLPDNLESTKLEVIEDLASKMMRYMILTYDGESIKHDETILNFEKVKTACLDNVNFVYLLYQNRLYIPQYINESQVSFSTTYISGGKPQTHRIYITVENTIHKEDVILAKGE